MKTILELDAFAHDWMVDVLAGPPMIAPARQYTYPMAVAGEEDALARGAMYLLVRGAAGTFLATCALGYRDPSMPTGVYATPDPRMVCAVAGGYAYLIDTNDPTRPVHIEQRPVTAVLATESLLLFAGFHTIQAWGKDGLAWSSKRLSWDGIQMGEVRDGVLRGLGWNMMTDRDIAFELNLATGEHTGGGF